MMAMIMAQSKMFAKGERILMQKNIRRIKTPIFTIRSTTVFSIGSFGLLSGAISSIIRVVVSFFPKLNNILYIIPTDSVYNHIFRYY
jgi:hypothetical protein